MPDFILKQNDTEPPITNTLYQADGTPQDLSGCTALLALRPITVGGAQPVTHVATVGMNTVSYQPTALDTAVEGMWLGGWIVTFPGGHRQTFPTDQPLSLIIQSDPSAPLPTVPATRGTSPGDALYRLQRMTAWTTPPCLTSVDMAALLQACRRVDSAGLWVTDKGWLPTFDLNWAAAEAWDWKAALSSPMYHIKDGAGGDLQRHQVFQHCEKRAEEYRRRSQGTPMSIRAQGGTLVDRLDSTNLLPWWYGESSPVN